MDYRAYPDAVTSTVPVSTFVMELNGTVRASPVTGRMPRRVESATREANDKNYAARMSKARMELASEFETLDKPSLATLRLKRGLSQTELARRMRTSQSHIAKIESGIVELYLKTAIKLADALEISLDDLRPLAEINQSDEPSMSTVTIDTK